MLSSKGPLLIAANHPNSFLDAVLLATLFKRPVYSLVRGDVYKNRFYAFLLNSLNMMPVYRISEGVENLGQNYDTFDKCREIFKKNGIVLIFSEGRCINEWHLRPLKKGTARLAISSWEEGIDLEILPTGINYQSFISFGKNIHLNFGKIIKKENINITNGHGSAINDFNKILRDELQILVKEIDRKDIHTIKKTFTIQQPVLKRILFFLPAALGFILHLPLYIPVKLFSKLKGFHNDHYDSVLVGLLFILYPWYVLLVMIFLSIITPGWYWLLPVLFMPFFAWCFVQLKRQF